MKKIFLINNILLIPLLIVIAITFFLFIFLLSNKDPHKPPSVLLNQNLPEFVIVNLFNNNEILTKNDIQGKRVIINFFASWCIPCKAEHPLLFELKNNYTNVMIIGINYKENDSDAIKFLENNGNPYHYVGLDKVGKIGLEFGVFGLPETFLINNKGKIIYKQLGPITEKILKDEIIPFLQ